MPTLIENKSLLSFDNRYAPLPALIASKYIYKMKNRGGKRTEEERRGKEKRGGEDLNKSAQLLTCPVLCR